MFAGGLMDASVAPGSMRKPIPSEGGRMLEWDLTSSFGFSVVGQNINHSNCRIYDSCLILTTHFLLQAYYAIFLNKGRLEVHLSSGTRTMRKIVIKPEPNLFHDGREHSVHMERTRG